MAAETTRLLLQRMGLGSSGVEDEDHHPKPQDDEPGEMGQQQQHHQHQQLAECLQMMQTLQSTHPQAYEAFLRAQAEAAAALEQAQAGGGGVIVPSPGFVACAAIEAAGPRISEAGEGGTATRNSSSSSSSRMEPLFVNIVSHDAVQRPLVRSSAGSLVLVEEEQSWSAELDVQVPLLVGQPRTIVTSAKGEAHQQARQQPQQQRAHAVDVVVHPWVVREALRHRAFQAQVVALAFEWVEEEAGLRSASAAATAVLPTALCSYAGDDGDGREACCTPRPFVLDEAVTQQQLAPEDRPGRSLQGPQSLLATLRRQQQQQQQQQQQESERPAAGGGSSIQARRPPARRVPIVVEDENEENEAPGMGLRRGFLLDG